VHSFEKNQKKKENSKKKEKLQRK